ncbi:MAG: SIS domain-containing protein, partial [Puniceicoccales bacterium]|nr:SIS domain-containing protein [Puniceicoccales bacterium]
MGTEENSEHFVSLAREVLHLEAAAIGKTAELLSESFAAVVTLILQHAGGVVLCGVGKSGMIAQKIATTLISTGTKSTFLHPTDALHGDLGIYSPGDPTLLFSRSGTTDELLTLIPLLRHFQSPLVAIVGNPNSPLARQCD